MPFRPTKKRTSTSESSTPTAAPYFLSTKEGTDPAVFDSYLKSIGKENEGPMGKYPSSPWQSQMINLTAEQAADAEAQSFMFLVLLVMEPPEVPQKMIFSQSSEQDIQARAPQDLVRRPNSDTHLRILSSRMNPAVGDLFADMDMTTPLSDLLPYLYDPVLGKGQTIYIVDEGFGIDHLELALGNSGRTVSWHYLPDSVTLGTTPIDDRTPEDIRTYSGHGTHIASIAAGHTHGVASNANLVLVKHKNAARNKFKKESIINRDVTQQAMEDTWSWMVEDVTARRNAGDNGKFIVNLSNGFDSKGSDDVPNSAMPRKSEIMARALKECWKHDIITVVAAGDDGNYDSGALDNATPQNHGTSDNPLITVGGVHYDGTLWTGTNFDRQQGGSISVFAQAVDVVGAGFVSHDASLSLDGTSQSAPAVAGLSAYFASLESLAQYFPPGEVAMKMKEYILRYAYTRNSDPIPAHANYPPAKEDVIVAYNRAPDGLCSRANPARRSVLGNLISGSVSRRQDGLEENVVVDGNVVASSWSSSYCAAATGAPDTTSSAASTLATTTSTTTSSTTTSPTSLPPQPTVQIADGLLTCGTGTHDDDETVFFGLDEMAAARQAFCSNITSERPKIVFKPGEEEYYEHVYTVPNNIFHRIKVSAHWDAPKETDCKKWDFSIVDTPLRWGDARACDDCVARIDIPIHNCVIFQGQNDFWKQGGKFVRDCVTWIITAADDD